MIGLEQIGEGVRKVDLFLILTIIAFNFILTTNIFSIVFKIQLVVLDKLNLVLEKLFLDLYAVSLWCFFENFLYSKISYVLLFYLEIGKCIFIEIFAMVPIMSLSSALDLCKGDLLHSCACLLCHESVCLGKPMPTSQYLSIAPSLPRQKN